MPKPERERDEDKHAGCETRAPVDPASQSPDPIEFCADDEVARGNEERANAEPEPAALHSAEVPGKPDVAAQRRAAQREQDGAK